MRHQKQIVFIFLAGIWLVIFSLCFAQPELKVEGILGGVKRLGGEKRLAVVNGKIIREGDSVGGATVLEIGSDSVKFQYQGTIFVKKLDEQGEKKDVPADRKSDTKENITNETDITLLLDMLGCKKRADQWNAIEALGKLGDRRAVEPLLQILLNDKKDDYTRALAAKALGMIGDNRAVNGLCSVLKITRTRDLGYSSIPANAAEALAIIGDRDAVSSLIAVLKEEGDDWHYAQRSAVKALGELRDSRAVIPLLDTLKKGDSVGKLIPEALGKIGDKSATKSLIELLKDKDRDIRLRAIIALGLIGDQSAAKPLIELLKEKDENVRSETIIALGTIGDSAAIDPLVRTLWRESNETVIQQIIQALARIGKPSEASVAALLKDKDAGMKYRVAKAFEVLQRDTRDEKEKEFCEIFKGEVARVSSERIRVCIAPFTGAFSDTNMEKPLQIPFDKARTLFTDTLREALIFEGYDAVGNEQEGCAITLDGTLEADTQYIGFFTVQKVIGMGKAPPTRRGIVKISLAEKYNIKNKVIQKNYVQTIKKDFIGWEYVGDFWERKGRDELLLSACKEIASKIISDLKRIQ